MADLQKISLAERDVEQAIIALKKGAYLLKYGRRGKPKFCPFRLSNDETMVIWYSGKEEKQLKLSHVSRIIPGQRTAIFQRYPRPEKEYQSFSLIYSDRSLDLICKDKDEAEVWFVGLKALIARCHQYCKWQGEARSETHSSDSPQSARRISPASVSLDAGDTQRNQFPFDNIPQSRLVKAFSDIISYTAAAKANPQSESFASSISSGHVENSNGRSSVAETFRVSLSSAVSSSSQGSCHEDFDALGDVFVWGEAIGDGLLPKALESTVVLDVHNIACGSRHAVLVTKQGEIFSWGEESGGRLGHGVETDVSHPKLIDSLSGMHIELVACGEYHTCAVTFSGDLYTWGDGTHHSGLLGNGNKVSHWLPKKLSGPMDGIRVAYISCGPWHTAVVTSAGQLFTFGDGSFGVLGHGDHSSTPIPREVETLRGLRTVRVSCGVWHTAAVVEVMTESECPSCERSGSTSSGKLFTWGDGDKGRLGHGDKESRLVPECIASLVDLCFRQVACGHDVTIALTTTGRVYSMGSALYGQLGTPTSDRKLPTCVEGSISSSFVEEIACGSYHVAALTSKAEVYTWGKGANGQLGLGDYNDRNTPTLVDYLKDKQVKSVVCGSNFTAVICIHKWVSSADHSLCSGCHHLFGFRRKRHNCYNCGLVFCKACSSKKSLKAALAPNMNKPYRVCDDCFTKLKKAIESGTVARIPRVRSGTFYQNSSKVVEKETPEPRLPPTHISRLSSVDSLNFDNGGKPKNRKRVGKNMNGSFQWGSFYTSKESMSLAGTSRKVFSASVPGSRIVSRSTSPVSGKSSPPRSSTPPPFLTVPETHEFIPDDPKNANDNLSHEILGLKAQVEDLTIKSRLLEAELERKSTQLEEVTAVAADEAEKCKAAKEVIKSLTAQLKEMAERMPDGHIAGRKLASIATNNLNPVSSESHEATQISPDSESKENNSASPIVSDGTVAHSEKVAEWVVQDEPGVYITLSPLLGGGYEITRVRFSRRRFSEDQAEKWWAANKAKVFERQNILKTGPGVP